MTKGFPRRGRKGVENNKGMGMKTIKEIGKRKGEFSRM